MEWKPRLKIFQGSNRKNTFNPETFEGRSFGWWCYVLKVKGKVIFNDYSYSVTTSAHQNEMKAFLRSQMKVKNIIFVNQRESLSNGIYLDHFYETLALAEIRSKSPNRRDDFYKTQKTIIAQTRKTIALLKKLGAKEVISLAQYRDVAKDLEMKRLQDQRERSKISRVKHKEITVKFKAEYESLDAITI